MKLMMGIVMALTLSACATPPAPTASVSVQPASASAALSPASMNCIQNNGTLRTEGNTTWCLLPGGKRCEEWDMFRGNCPTRTVNAKMGKWAHQTSG